MQTTAPFSGKALIEMVHQGSSKQKNAAVKKLLGCGALVELEQLLYRSKSNAIWTPEKAKAAGLALKNTTTEAGQP